MATLDRLRALVRGTGEARSPAVPGSPPRRELTYEPVDASGLPLETRKELPAIDGAAFVDTPYGRAVAVERVLEAETWHGRMRIDRAEIGPDEIALLSGGEPWPVVHGMSSPASADDAARASLPVLFLDLETTGLSGGAGTVAFLVGCGWFDAGAFRTRQFLLPGFGAERAMLTAVASVLADFAGLVTYNGKTFDLPVMETRWLFQRMTPPWDVLPHLDMLHLARRLWSHREDEAASVEHSGCRLVALERALLGVERVGDVAGWEIPTRYFEFIRYGDAAVLAPVLYHNQVDLLSLGCLAARAARLLREGAEAAADGAELVALGREYRRRGVDEDAEACFRHALARRDVMSELRGEALYGLARLLRRGRRHAEAAPLWHELARTAAVRSPLQHEAREALAVHYEHRDRDLGLATHWARQAAAASNNRRRQDETARRLARLGRKLERRSFAPSLGLPLDAV